MGKKIGAILLFLLLLVGLVTGCGEEKLLDAKNPVTVTLWHYYSGANLVSLEQAIQEFNGSIGLENGIVVTPSAYGSIGELMEAVTASSSGMVGAAAMPHIFSSYPDFAMDIDQMDMLCDLTPYFDEAEKNAYVQSFLSDGIFEGGRMVLVPVAKSTEILYLNKTAWDAFKNGAGRSDSELATWEGLVELAADYYRWVDSQTPNTAWDGKAFMGLDSVANYVIVANRQLGVEILHAEGSGGRVLLNREAMGRIFEVYYKAYAVGWFDAVGRFRSDDVKSGDLEAFVGSTSGAAYFPTEVVTDSGKTSIEFTALPYPTFSGGQQVAIQQGAGMAVSVSDKAHQLAATMFLKWFTEAKQNIDFAMNSGYLPVRTATYEDAMFNHTLDGLRGGSRAEQNMAQVYDIAFGAVTGGGTYAAKPFPGSNDTRTLLESTLKEQAEAGRATALALKGQGREEEEILLALDVDGAFADWLAALTTSLDRLGVAYEYSS